MYRKESGSGNIRQTERGSGNVGQRESGGGNVSRRAKKSRKSTTKQDMRNETAEEGNSHQYLTVTFCLGQLQTMVTYQSLLPVVPIFGTVKWLSSPATMYRNLCDVWNWYSTLGVILSSMIPCNAILALRLCVLFQNVTSTEAVGYLGCFQTSSERFSPGFAAPRQRTYTYVEPAIRQRDDILLATGRFVGYHLPFIATPDPDSFYYFWEESIRRQAFIRQGQNAESTWNQRTN
ncbi:hypothetical protein BU17DRAFT_64731 [Hysterangium stoloniferum]|nr:hypothetical protein BU17DRAFT_64731 [Hysterangium stoloniferum]